MFYRANASAHVCQTEVFVLCRGEGAPTYRFFFLDVRPWLSPVAGRHVPRQPYNGETVINDGSVNILFSPAVFSKRNWSAGGPGKLQALSGSCTISSQNSNSDSPLYRTKSDFATALYRPIQPVEP